MPLTEAMIARALEVTGAFEGAGAPFSAVAGDFDGMGLSMGALQWNLGSGTLQPLVRAAGREAVCGAMPALGDALWRACQPASARAAGVALARGWHAPGGRLRPAVLAELRAFAASPAFRAQQLGAARRIALGAHAEARDWAASWGRAEPTAAEFLWFFDLLVQNGGLKGVDAAAVRGFVAGCGGPAGAVAAVCAWLAGRRAGEAGAADARANAELWRGAVPRERVPLLALAHLRALRADARWRADVLNRKGTLAVGRGRVHGRDVDLRAAFGDATPPGPPPPRPEVAAAA